MYFNKVGEIGFGLKSDKYPGTRKVRFIGYGRTKFDAIYNATRKAMHLIKEDGMYKVKHIECLNATKRSRYSWFVNMNITAQPLNYKTKGNFKLR